MVFLAFKHHITSPDLCLYRDLGSLTSSVIMKFIKVKILNSKVKTRQWLQFVAKAVITQPSLSNQHLKTNLWDYSLCLIILTKLFYFSAIALFSSLVKYLTIIKPVLEWRSMMLPSMVAGRFVLPSLYRFPKMLHKTSSLISLQIFFLTYYCCIIKKAHWWPATYMDYSFTQSTKFKI